MLAAAATWRFTPFLARGKPVRVCAIEKFSDSPDLQARPRERPVHAIPTVEPGGPPLNIPPNALIALRIAGEPAIAPR